MLLRPQLETTSLWLWGDERLGVNAPALTPDDRSERETAQHGASDGEHRTSRCHTRLPNESVHKVRGAPTRSDQAHSDKRLFAAKVGRAPSSAKRAAGGARPVSFMH